MKKHFYSEIISNEFISIVLLELDGAKMSKREKEYLTTIFYSSIHATVVDTVLTELSEDRKKVFLTMLHGKSHDTIWNFLKETTQGIEGKISKSVEKITKEFLQDLLEIKNS